MSNYNFLVALVIILGVCGSGFVFAYLKKNGVKIDTIIKDTEEGIEDVGTVIKAGKSISNNEVLNTLDVIDTVADSAVKAVNQLYRSSQLPVDERKPEAKKIIQSGLKLANIKETPEIDVLIDAAIEKIIGENKITDEKITQATANLQAQINQLNTEKVQLQTANSSLTTKNSELTNKVASIQATLK